MLQALSAKVRDFCGHAHQTPRVTQKSNCCNFCVSASKCVKLRVSELGHVKSPQNASEGYGRTCRFFRRNESPNFFRWVKFCTKFQVVHMSVLWCNFDRTHDNHVKITRDAKGCVFVLAITYEHVFVTAACARARFCWNFESPTRHFFTHFETRAQNFKHVFLKIPTINFFLNFESWNYKCWSIRKTWSDLGTTQTTFFGFKVTVGVVSTPIEVGNPQGLKLFHFRTYFKSPFRTW